jgi:hypothetical protein
MLLIQVGGGRFAQHNSQQRSFVHVTGNKRVGFQPLNCERHEET